MRISTKGFIKFVIGSLVATFLFLVPLPVDDAFDLPLGILINFLRDNLIFTNFLGFEEISFGVLVAFVVTLVVALGTILAYLNVGFIVNNETLKKTFRVPIVFGISRVIGFVFVSMVLFDFGPEVITGWIAGFVVNTLVNSLVFIFIVLSLAMPLLTEFGLMEFIGILIRKFVYKLFLLPGRASVDLASSWFGSSILSILITSDQHEKGFYTHREAASISVNFAVVSLPFTLIISETLGLGGNFALWYLMILIVCIILGVLLVRIWPLNRIPNTYLDEVGKQIDEEVEEGESLLFKAVWLASERANQPTVGQILKSGATFCISTLVHLIPLVSSWAIIAMVIEDATPFFDIIAMPMGWLLSVFNIPGAMQYASTTLVGFVDMFIPAMMLGPYTYFQTRFILGALSVIQIIYMAETGVLILKSKIPLGIGRLVTIFMIRTLIGLPLIVLFTWILTTLGWIG